ncbi:MAG: FHA domain-containing protein [bacterium]|nr:FHA domain-containing protein [bacterium]
MFALEIDFHDGVSAREVMMVRRPFAIVGGSESAHVVIEGTSGLNEIRFTRGLDGSFRCEYLRGGIVQGTMTEVITGSGVFRIGEVSLRLTALDSDLRNDPELPPDVAAINVLRRALAFPSPKFPALVVLGKNPIVYSFASDDIVLVGRSRRCGLRLDSAGVSSEHAQVGYDNGMFWVEDLGSTNGTYISGKLIAGRQYLPVGEFVQIGGDCFLAGVSQELEYEQVTRQANQQIANIPEVSADYPRILTMSEHVQPRQLKVGKKKRVTVGRDSGSDLWVSASHVSFNHLEIFYNSQSASAVTDTSSNGTYLNGMRLPRGESYALPPGPVEIDLQGGIKLILLNSAEDEELWQRSTGSEHKVSGIEEQVRDIGDDTFHETGDDSGLADSFEDGSGFESADQLLFEEDDPRYLAEDESDRVTDVFRHLSSGTIQDSGAKVESVNKGSTFYQEVQPRGGQHVSSSAGDVGEITAKPSPFLSQDEFEDFSEDAELRSTTVFDDEHGNYGLGKMGRVILVTGVILLVGSLGVMAVVFLQ